MKTNSNSSMSLLYKPTRRFALSLVSTFTLAAALVACGGGGNVPSNANSNASTARALSPEFGTLKAVAYSPFRTGNRDTETPTAANIKQDLDLLIAANFRLIRLFDSSDNVSKLTLEVIKVNKLDMKVMLGAYINSESSDYISPDVKAANAALNLAEINRTVKLANAYSDLVLAVSVGNETMVSWSFVPTSPTIMAKYITSVRSQITQPVTTDDNWAFYASAPVSITNAIDFASIHSYPILDTLYAATNWAWKQESVPVADRAKAMMSAAMGVVKSQYGQVRTYLDYKGLYTMPIVIGETGWKAEASGGEEFRAHPVNQKAYLVGLNDWSYLARSGAGPANIFYFEAFDEPWKQGDDKWGLFNVKREARYAMQSLIPNAVKEAGNYTNADGAYYIALDNRKIAGNSYTVYAETVTTGEQRPVKLIPNAWENGTTATAFDATDATAPEGSKSYAITPFPKDWGWGVAFTLLQADGKSQTSDDLSAFANGRLNLRIKTTYPGKLELGFYTGRGVDLSGTDTYLQLASGDYGYKNDGTWSTVSIPVKDFIAKVGTTDISKVTSALVVADRYVQTGKLSGFKNTVPVYVDAISFTK